MRRCRCNLGVGVGFAAAGRLLLVGVKQLGAGMGWVFCGWYGEPRLEKVFGLFSDQAGSLSHVKAKL